MQLYVKRGWIEDMNEKGLVHLYTEDGEDSGAKVTIKDELGASPTEPMIWNLLGCGDHLPLMRVKLNWDGGMKVIWMVNEGWSNGATFPTFNDIVVKKTEWGIDYEEDDE